MSVWQIIAQVAIGLVTAAVSFLAVRLGIREANRRGGREEWWRRFTWAVERRSSDDPLLQMAGNALLHKLFDSPMAGAEERQVLLEAMWLATVGSRPADATSGGELVPWDLRAETAQWLLRADPVAASASPVLQKLAGRAKANEALYHASRVVQQRLGTLCEILRAPSDPALCIAYCQFRPEMKIAEVELLLGELLPTDRICLAVVDDWPVGVSGKTQRSELTPANFPPRPEIVRRSREHIPRPINNTQPSE